VLLSFIPLISGIALTMSPMTSAIMSAVPERRAGAGSAMNDATRELGAALGVAVLGSIAASRYTSSLDGAINGLPAGARESARSSLAGALQVASRLPASAGRLLTTASQHAFVDGIRVASLAGLALALIAAVVVHRYLPAVTTHGVSADNETVEADPQAVDDELEPASSLTA
jgi:hypothetical protein